MATKTTKIAEPKARKPGAKPSASKAAPKAPAPATPRFSVGEIVERPEGGPPMRVDVVSAAGEGFDLLCSWDGPDGRCDDVVPEASVRLYRAPPPAPEVDTAAERAAGAAAFVAGEDADPAWSVDKIDGWKVAAVGAVAVLRRQERPLEIAEDWSDALDESDPARAADLLAELRTLLENEGRSAQAEADGLIAEHGTAMEGAAHPLRPLLRAYLALGAKRPTMPATKTPEAPPVIDDAPRVKDGTGAPPEAVPRCVRITRPFIVPGRQLRRGRAWDARFRDVYTGEDAAYLWTHHRANVEVYPVVKP